MKNNIWLYIKYFICAALLVSIVKYFIGNQEFLVLLHDMDLFYFALNIPVIFLYYIIASVNIYILLKLHQKNISWGGWFKYHFIKRFLNLHIPQAGNVYEAVKMKKKYGVELSKYAVIFAIVNCFNLTFNCVIAVIILILWQDFSLLQNLVLAGIVLFIIGIHFLIPPLLAYLLGRLSKYPGLSIAISNYSVKFQGLIEVMQDSITNFRVLSKLVFWSFLSLINSMVILVLCFHTLGLTVSLPDLVPFVIMNSLLGMVNIIPQNLGVAEYSYGIIGNAFSFTMTIGILVALIIRLGIYIASGIFFLTFFLQDRMKLY